MSNDGATPASKGVLHSGLIIINYDFLNGRWQSKIFFLQCTTDELAARDLSFVTMA